MKTDAKMLFEEKINQSETMLIASILNKNKIQTHKRLK